MVRDESPFTWYAPSCRPLRAARAGQAVLSGSLAPACAAAQDSPHPAALFCTEAAFLILLVEPVPRSSCALAEVRLLLLLLGPREGEVGHVDVQVFARATRWS